MLPAFAEAIRASTQPCTLLLVLVPLIMAVVTRGRWPPFVAMCIGAVLGGWLVLANVVALSDSRLQVSGGLVVDRARNDARLTCGVVAAMGTAPVGADRRRRRRDVHRHPVVAPVHRIGVGFDTDRVA